MPEGRPYRTSPYTIMEDMAPLQVASPQVPIEAPATSVNNNSYSGIGFGSAFADARRKGLKTFEWYNPKTKKKGSYHTRTKEEMKPGFNETKVLKVNDTSNSDPVKPINTYKSESGIMNTYGRKPDMSGFKFDGNIPLPPTMQNRPGQREFSKKLAEDLVKSMALQVATMGLAGGINAITQGSKGMVNAYQVANTSRKGLAPGMKALGYETGQIPPNVDNLLNMIMSGVGKGREALRNKEVLNYLDKTIKYGQSLQ